MHNEQAFTPPSKIEITSDEWSQIQINSTSDTDSPSEIAMHRRNKNVFLATAMGVSGDMERGAFWWAGGPDRMNIHYETGVVRISDDMTTPDIHTNVILGLTAEATIIQDNVIITGS